MLEGSNCGPSQGETVTRFEEAQNLEPAQQIPESGFLGPATNQPNPTGPWSSSGMASPCRIPGLVQDAKVIV
jgi:hypothetical protein